MADRFLTLLLPHRSDLERYCRAMLRSSGEVADVLQEALSRALRDFERFQEGTAFRAFVFRYVVHETRNQMRRTSTRGRREKALEQDPIDATGCFLAEVGHETLLAAPHLVLEQCEDEVRHAFLRLPAPQRAAFLLMSLGGFRARDVGELLQMPMGTVLSLVFRARVQLRRQLASVARDRGLLPRGEPR